MRDLYQEVTDRIIAAVETGTPPWVQPWSRTADPRPANAATQRPYRGINSLLLGLEAQVQGYPLNRWLTFRQTAKLGGRIRKGEKGTTVVFYKLHEITGEPMADESPDRRVIPLLRAFTVFNLAQIEGLPDNLAMPAVPVVWDSQAEAEHLILASGADLRHGGNQAYYDWAQDSIQVPPKGAFADPGAYYATALHELVHWTGHRSRCARDLTGRFGDAAYAMEELVAEMGAAFLCAHCHIDGRLQHAAYVRAWLPVLQRDKRAIVTAASKAQAAADYLFARACPEQQEGAAA